MNAELIAKLIVALGPTALELIPKLSAVWTKPDLTIDEVATICAVSKTPYEDYVAQAGGRPGK